MKYIDADKLKAEIERLKDEYTDIAIDSHYGTVNANSVVDDLERLLSLTDTLQQEQSESSVENYIQSYLEAIGFGYGGWVDGLRDEDLKKIARHFYKLGLKARKEE